MMGDRDILIKPIYQGEFANINNTTIKQIEIGPGSTFVVLVQNKGQYMIKHINKIGKTIKQFPSIFESAPSLRMLSQTEAVILSYKKSKMPESLTVWQIKRNKIYSLQLQQLSKLKLKLKRQPTQASQPKPKQKQKQKQKQMWMYQWKWGYKQEQEQGLKYNYRLFVFSQSRTVAYVCYNQKEYFVVYSKIRQEKILVIDQAWGTLGKLVTFRQLDDKSRIAYFDEYFSLRDPIAITLIQPPLSDPIPKQTLPYKYPQQFQKREQFLRVRVSDILQLEPQRIYIQISTMVDEKKAVMLSRREENNWDDFQQFVDYVWEVNDESIKQLYCNKQSKVYIQNRAHRIQFIEILRQITTNSNEAKSPRKRIEQLRYGGSGINKSLQQNTPIYIYSLTKSTVIGMYPQNFYKNNYFLSSPHQPYLFLQITNHHPSTITNISNNTNMITRPNTTTNTNTNTNTTTSTSTSTAVTKNNRKTILEKKIEFMKYLVWKFPSRFRYQLRDVVAFFVGEIVGHGCDQDLIGKCVELVQQGNVGDAFGNQQSKQKGKIQGQEEEQAQELGREHRFVRFVTGWPDSSQRLH